MHAAERFKFRLNVATPPELAPRPLLLERARAAGAAIVIGTTGFSAEQLERFLPAVMEFLKGRLPEETVKQLTGLLPAPAETHA